MGGRGFGGGLGEVMESGFGFVGEGGGGEGMGWWVEGFLGGGGV